ncbi:helix-turn-helix domain-containing protein [Streptomyces sp. NPDC048430]|uniref:ArsR/SmtB family transcription factor n=1 Tax=Streptomyces sp. NPDC048430 TaxID=3155388 RepID=UPI00344A7E2D
MCVEFRRTGVTGARDHRGCACYGWTADPDPAGPRTLADGCPEALHRLGTALRAYHQVAVEPYLTAMRAQAAADRTVRAQAVLSHGAEGLLTGYDQLPGWRYREGRLRAPYPIERELSLRGRTLTLVPAFFCVRARSSSSLLRMLDRPMTTMDIAAALRLAPSTASRHATVLREAGLLLSQRQGVRVLHHRTGLGRAVLEGVLK